ncbi:MAG: hypothetical protein ABIJ09_10185 [Pseudomonadota bacterium]
MPRISKTDVNTALQRAAQNILDASKPDGIASRADIEKKLGQLEGTEKQLTDIFFRFIDHRDHVPGARVTKNDIDKALAYAKDKLIGKYDLNNNGLSKAEIAKMSTTGKLAVELAKELAKAAPVDGGAGAATDPEALAFVKANAGDDGLFHDVEGGNVGLHAYALSAEDGGTLIQALRAFDYNPSLPEIQDLNSFAFDPDKHAVYGVLETEDEPQLSVVVVDRQSGETRRLGLSMNFVDANDAVAALFPGASSDGEFDSFKGIAEALRNGKDLLAGSDPDWSIADFG